YSISAKRISLFSLTTISSTMERILSVALAMYNAIDEVQSITKTKSTDRKRSFKQLRHTYATLTYLRSTIRVELVQVEPLSPLQLQKPCLDVFEYSDDCRCKRT